MTLGVAIAARVRDQLPVTALAVHVPRGSALSPLVTEPGETPDALARLELLAHETDRTGRATRDGNAFAFPLTNDQELVAVASGLLTDGLHPDAVRLEARFGRLAAELEPMAVQLDTALLFSAFRDAATTDERRRLAREMHDGVAQEIASIGYLVDGIAAQSASAAQEAQLRMLRDRITRVVAEVRRSVQSLRSEVSESDSLGAAIGRIARHLSDSSGIPILVSADERTTRLRTEVEAELLRIAQEAMTNAVRHSGALLDRGPLQRRRPHGRDRGPRRRRGARARDAPTPTASRSCTSARAWWGQLCPITDGAPHGTVLTVRLPGPAAEHRRRSPRRREGHRMSEATPTRVLLVDDHDLIREGLSMVFAAEPATEVVGAAKTVAEAIAMYDQLKPDVIVTDLQLQDGTGLDVVRTVRRDRSETGIVVLTMHAGDDQIFAAMEAGASAFVGKDAPSTEVVKAAKHAAVSPRSFLCSGLAEAFMRRTSSESTRLTTREHDVLVLLADGLSAAEIGGRLHLSESTVKSHVAHLYQKLGAANRAQALVTAMRIGLLASGPGSVSTTNLGKK